MGAAIETIWILFIETIWIPFEWYGDVSPCAPDGSKILHIWTKGTRQWSFPRLQPYRALRLSDVRNIGQMRETQKSELGM